MKKQKISWLSLRIGMAFIFLWAFFDKTFGLGFATKPEASWLSGNSPTTGFLLHATEGPFASFFQSLAHSNLVDWLFMLGLLGIGLSLLLNKYIKWGAICGSFMMLLMWLATFPPENNPLIDEHIIYILVFLVLAVGKDRDR